MIVRQEQTALQKTEKQHEALSLPYLLCAAIQPVKEHCSVTDNSSWKKYPYSFMHTFPLFLCLLILQAGNFNCNYPSGPNNDMHYSVIKLR
jgi:hypothetical protein